MRTYSKHMIWIAALLTLAFCGGCCDTTKIGATLPAVISVTPANASGGICPSATLTATFSEAMNPSTVNAATFLVTGPGTTVVPGQVVYDASTNIATFTPSTALAVSVVYSGTITTGAKDAYGNSLATNYAWSFTTAANGCHAPPAVASVTPPSGSAGVCPNAPISVTFDEPMNPDTVNATTFTLSPAVVGTISHDAANQIFTFTPSTGLALNATYTATVAVGAQDTYGNSLPSNFSWSFTTAANGCNPPPTVVSMSPPAGSTGVCQNRIITATFSEAMAPLTINATTFTLKGPTGAAVAGQVSYSAASGTAIFTPTNPMALGVTYTATVTTGAEDLFGNFMAAPVVWTFTTSATTCTPPNPPVAVTPPDGSVNVCTSAVVGATFGQPMNPASINALTFTLTGPGNTAVAGQVTHDVTNEIFTFVPNNNLAVSTLYTATITTGATDTAGNALANNYVWTFTTGAIPCDTGIFPEVISVTPPDGSVGACLNTVPSATFSEAMNPATITNATFTLTPAAVGTVALDGSGRIATLTPSANLAISTTYTATITTGAQDTSGNALSENYTWTFTTATQPCQPPVPLGTAANFAILAGATVTNNGPTIISNGNLGLNPGTSITGFPPGTVTAPGVIDDTNTDAAQAEADLTIAYNYIIALKGGAALANDLSGLTITPGLYTNASTVMLSSGNVTLDAQGNSNAVFIFQIGSAFTTLGSTQVILAGGAQAKNIFWQIASSATLGTYSAFQGTILALDSVTLDTGATLVGRALARNAAVSLSSNTVTGP